MTAASRPPDSATARLAPSADAGRPIRMALAMVAGRSTGLPMTSGAAPAAWNPSITGRRSVASV